MQNSSPSPSPLEQRHGPAYGGDPVLDRAAFSALEELAGDDDPDLVSEIIQLYLDDSAGRMSDVKSGFEESEHVRIGSAAHALKSSSANIGAVAFSKTCADLEHCVRSTDGVDLEELDRLCGQALAMYGEVRSVLDSFHSPA